MTDTDRVEDRFAAAVAELGKETDRGLALVGAAMVDEMLSSSLRAFMCNDGIGSKTADALLLSERNGVLSTFSARSDACVAFGLIDEDEYREIALIRKIRNKFAHVSAPMSFDTEPVMGLCATLSSHVPGDAPVLQTPRGRFLNAVVSVSIHLLYRPDQVAEERRCRKDWIGEHRTDSTWRSSANELPPPGMPVVALYADGTVRVITREE